MISLETGGGGGVEKRSYLFGFLLGGAFVSLMDGSSLSSPADKCPISSGQTASDSHGGAVFISWLFVLGHTEEDQDLVPQARIADSPQTRGR